MDYKDREKRRYLIMKKLGELFPTAEIESANDFCEGKVLFKLGWEGRPRDVWIEILPEGIDHVVSELSLREIK